MQFLNNKTKIIKKYHQEMNPVGAKEAVSPYNKGMYNSLFFFTLVRSMAIPILHNY